MVSRVYLKGGPKHGEVVLLAKEDLSHLFYHESVEPSVVASWGDNPRPRVIKDGIYEYRATGRVSDAGLRIFDIV